MKDRYLLPLLLMIVVVLLLGPPVGAQAQNQVALIVQRGDGSLVTRCVTFSEPYLTGYQILMRSGLDVVAAVGPLGAAICAIEGEGCEARNCFCSSPPNYWSYWKLVDGEWTYAQMGANSMQVHNGATEGWTWGPGSPPPAITFASVCTPPATPTDTPTETPGVIPTATSATPEPSPTQLDDPPPTVSSGEEATPSPTSPPIPTKPPPVPSIEAEDEGEGIAELETEPSASDDREARSDVRPELSPTVVRPQATATAQNGAQPTATMPPQEESDINPLTEPTDAETAPSARRLSSGYIIFAVLTGGLIGLLVLFGRR
jgi:hypothetical protein